MPLSLTIWVDADATPRPVKEVLFKAADRTQTPVVLVANQYLATPRSKYVKAMQVPKGFDVADDEIVQRVASGDIVITADIPLANEVVAKGAVALNPRGMLYTTENIKDFLQRRDMMESLRDTGQVSGGPAAYDARDKQNFANALDRLLVQSRQNR